MNTEPSVYKPYLALAALQVVDVLTTGWILSHFTDASEGNPVVGHLLDGVGLPLGMMMILVLKLAVVYSLWTRQTGAKIILSIYTLVVLNNLLVLLLWLTS